MEYLEFITFSLPKATLLSRYNTETLFSFLDDRFGSAGAACYNFVIGLRLISEVFANLLVIGILYSSYSSGMIESIQYILYPDWSRVDSGTPLLALQRAFFTLALGLGIGAFMTTFTVYYLMSGNPIPHKSDVLFSVQLDNWDPNEPPTESARDVQPQLTYRDGTALMLAETPARRQVHMYGTGAIVVPEDETPPFDESVRATWYTFFEMFDVPFLYGQSWTRNDDEARASVVVIGRELNDRLFDGENSVGRSIQLDDAHYQVVGVIDDWQPMPRFYHADWSRAFEDAEQLYMPMNRAIDAQFGPRGNTNCWKAPDENLPLFEAFLQSECVFTQFWAELETPEQAAALLLNIGLAGLAVGLGVLMQAGLGWAATPLQGAWRG